MILAGFYKAGSGSVSLKRIRKSKMKLIRIRNTGYNSNGKIYTMASLALALVSIAQSHVYTVWADSAVQCSVTFFEIKSFIYIIHALNLANNMRHFWTGNIYVPVESSIQNIQNALFGFFLPHLISISNSTIAFIFIKYKKFKVLPIYAYNFAHSFWQDFILRKFVKKRTWFLLHLVYTWQSLKKQFF